MVVYLEGGEVGTDVDGVSARVGGVGWGTLGGGHGQQVGLLAVGVVFLVVLPHQVQELLREQRAETAAAAQALSRLNHRLGGCFARQFQRQEQHEKREDKA